MEAADRELLATMLDRDVRLQRLYREHQELEKRLGNYHKRPYLTGGEELEQKELKRRKLAGVDRMMRILNEHRAV